MMPWAARPAWSPVPRISAVVRATPLPLGPDRSHIAGRGSLIREITPVMHPSYHRSRRLSAAQDLSAGSALQAAGMTAYAAVSRHCAAVLLVSLGVGLHMLGVAR